MTQHAILKDYKQENNKTWYNYHVVFIDENNNTEILNLDSIINHKLEKDYNVIKVNNFYILTSYSERFNENARDYIIHVNPETKEVSVKFVGCLNTNIIFYNTQNPHIFGLTNQNKKLLPVIINLNENSFDIKLLDIPIEHKKNEFIEMKHMLSKQIVTKNKLITGLIGFGGFGYTFIYDTIQQKLIFFKAEENKENYDISDIDIFCSKDFLDGKTDYFICRYKTNNMKKISIYYKDKELLNKTVAIPWSQILDNNLIIDFDKNTAIDQDTKYIAITNADRKSFSVYEIKEDNIVKIKNMHIDKIDSNYKAIRFISQSKNGKFLCVLSDLNNREHLAIIDIHKNQIKYLSILYSFLYMLDLQYNEETSKPIKHSSHASEEKKINARYFLKLLTDYCKDKSNYYISYDFDNKYFVVNFINNQTEKFKNLIYVSDNHFIATNDEQLPQLIKIDNNNTIKVLKTFKGDLPNVYITENNIIIQDVDGLYIYTPDNLNEHISFIPITNIIIDYTFGLNNIIIIGFTDKNNRNPYNSNIIVFNNKEKTVKSVINNNAMRIVNYPIEQNYNREMFENIFKYPHVISSIPSYSSKELFSIFDKNGNLCCSIESNDKLKKITDGGFIIKNEFEWFMFEKQIDRIVFLMKKLPGKSINKNNTVESLKKLKF